MKKKLVLAIICLLLVALCLTACADYSAQFNKINSLLNAHYSKMKLTVTVTQDLDTLTSWFEVESIDDDTSTVSFNIQRFATFPEDGSLPDSFVKTYQGSATVNRKSGVTNVTGDVPDDVRLENISSIGIRFNSVYFSNVSVKGNVLSAKVSKPQAFMGQSDFSCQANSMVVTVSYGSLLNYIRVQYTANNGAKVVLMYDFTA